MEDVSYYDSQMQYQKRVGEIEKERFKLEREMIAMMKSDKRLENLKTAKLRTYWQQICDREKIARQRNDELIRDFEQLEIRLATMDAQTKKLKTMKLDYDEKVKRMYMKWYKEIEVARAKRQLQQKIIPNQTDNVNSAIHHDISTIDGSHQQKVLNKETSSKSVLSKSSPTSSNVRSVPDAPILNSAQVAVQPPPAAFADRNSFKAKELDKSTVGSPQKASNIVPTIPTATIHNDGSFDDDLSDSFSHSDESFRERPQDQSVPTIQSTAKLCDGSTNVSKPTTVVAVHVHKQNSQDISEQRQSVSTSSVHGTETVTKDVARPMVSRVAKSGSERSSDSFESDLSMKSPITSLTPRNDEGATSNQALKASAAYQSMLKQYTGVEQHTDESEDDDFEDLFSGDGTAKSVEKDHDKAGKSGFSASLKHNESSHVGADPSARSSTLQKEKPASRHMHKADWDTDSDEEPEGYLSNTGGSSKWDQKLRQYDDDDDDFFD